MCDGYCKYIERINSEIDSFEKDEAAQKTFDQICRKCPMTQLEELEHEVIKVKIDAGDTLIIKSKVLLKGDVLEDLRQRMLKEIQNEGVVIISEPFDVYVARGSRKEENMKWIQCNERLPEDGFYLVTKRQKTGELVIAIGHYSMQFGWSGSGNFNDVLAWMPLPELWKEK